MFIKYSVKHIIRKIKNMINSSILEKYMKIFIDYLLKNMISSSILDSIFSFMTRANQSMKLFINDLNEKYEDQIRTIIETGILKEFSRFLLGIFIFSGIGVKLGFELPTGMGYGHLVVVGIIAGLGLTVALFVAGAAYTGDLLAFQGPAKMGALFSGANFLFAIVMARVLLKK